jgi:hypothetical protein
LLHPSLHDLALRLQNTAYTPDLMAKLKVFKEMVAKVPGWRDPYPDIPT